MMILTISKAAPPADITAMAPIWQDANGAKFHVSSGLSSDVPADAWTPDSTMPPPAAPATIAGVDGLTAVALMGLVPVGDL